MINGDSRLDRENKLNALSLALTVLTNKKWID